MASAQSNKERMAAIAAYRAQLDKKIRQKERRMAAAYEELSTPSVRPKGAFSTLLANAGTIATMVDGALMGYRVMSQLRRIFK